MNKERWRELMQNEDATLTAQEIGEGWHFCYEFDGLLVGPGMSEQECCTSHCGKPINKDKP